MADELELHVIFGDGVSETIGADACLRVAYLLNDSAYIEKETWFKITVHDSNPDNEGN